MLFQFLKQKGPISRGFLFTFGFVRGICGMKIRDLESMLNPDMWINVWGMAGVCYILIFLQLESSLWLVEKRYSRWRFLFGPLEDETLEQLRRAVLCMNQKVSIEEKLAATVLMIQIIAITAAYIWLVFL